MAFQFVYWIIILLNAGVLDARTTGNVSIYTQYLFSWKIYSYRLRLFYKYDRLLLGVHSTRKYKMNLKITCIDLCGSTHHSPCCYLVCSLSDCLCLWTFHLLRFPPVRLCIFCFSCVYFVRWSWLVSLKSDKINALNLKIFKF